jgi:hypothetical protein
MTYGVKLPDGRIIGFQDSTPREEAQLIVRRDFPEAFKKKEGLGAEFSEGLASLIGGTKTALTAPFDPKAAARRALLEEQARGAEFESGVGLDKLKKAYEERGLLGGAGELTRQVPLVLSSMAPQIAASLGSAAAGARIGSVAGLPGIIGGTLGGFGASFLPIAGQNIVRQAQEQETAGKEIDPSLAKAYVAAAPAAALEVGSLGFTLGKRVIGKVLGQSEQEIAEGLAKNAVKYEADLVKAAESKLLPTVGRGAARGLVELPTEVAQQIIERAQAGLELFSPDAIKEYGEAAYQATLVGPTLGGAAGPLNRAQARGELQELTERRRSEQAGVQAAEEQAYRASPEYVAELVGKREQLQEELGVLDGILKGKAQTDEEKQLKREAAANRKSLRFELDQLTESLREVAPETPGLPPTLEQRKAQERNRLDEMATLKQLRATDSKAADDYAKYIRAQDVYQAMQDKEAQRLLTKEEKARQKEAKAIIDAHNQSTKGIEKTADAVTDEFGNIVPGLTKKGALAGRELTVEQRISLEEYDNAVKALNEKLLASGRTKRQNLYDKTYVSDEASTEEIRQLQENLKDKYEAIKDFAGERIAPPQAETTIDKIIDQISAPPKDLKTELTPEQKEAETKRLADLQKYKKNFNDAVAYYEKLLTEAETVAQQPRNKGKRGQELYAKPVEGRSLEVLKKGEELKASLDALNKAKGELLNYLQEVSGTVVSPLESSEALKDLALLDVTDTIDSMRKGEFFGGPNPAMATGSLATKAIKARKELDRYITIVINSINAAREAKGLNKLSEKAVNEIQDKFLELFGGKIARATGKKARVLKAGEKPAEDTALRRAFEAAGFKVKDLPEGEGEIKTGFSREEFADVKDFTKQIQDTYTAKEREFGKLTRETTGDLFTEGRIKDTGKGRKTEGATTDIEKTARLLDRVFDADLTGEQRSVFERAEKLLAEGKRTKDTEATTATGTKNVMPGLVDAVNAQGKRVLDGLEPDLKDLREAIKRIEESLATPVQTQPSGKPATQLEFFPGETSTIRATRQNFTRLLAVKNRKGSAVINAARKFLERLKDGKPSALDFAKLFDNKDILELLKEANALDAEGAKFIQESKSKKFDPAERAERVAQANQAFQIADKFKKEAYDIYDAAAKVILKKLEKLDKPVEMLAQFELQKKKVEKKLKETLDKQAKEQAERNMPEYPERIKMLRLQKKTISTAINSTKERIAREEAEAGRKTGLGLPGTKSTIPVQPKAEAQLPHRYDAVETPFNFARQYFKEIAEYREKMLSRRSMTMNKSQTKAYQEAVQDVKDAEQKYQKAREKLTKALKENNVDKRIATIMNNMVEMESKTAAYRKLENTILGIEELLQQQVLGIRGKNVVTPIFPVKEDVVIDKALGYETPKVVKDEEFVGRISETELAQLRAEKQKRFDFIKTRLDSQKAPVEERPKLAKELAEVEKEIKAADVILNARQIGMAVGKAQEEMGAKLYKPTETEKAMIKAGKFDKAGIAPEYYATVAKAFRDRNDEVRKTAERKTPKYVTKLISQIVNLEERLKYGTYQEQSKYEDDPKTGKLKKVIVSVEEQKAETQKEINFLRKEIAGVVSRIKVEQITKAFEEVTSTMFRDKPGKSGGIDMFVADSFINNLIKKQGFDPTRRAVTTAIGAFSLPIKIPKLADVNADFRKMIVKNALGGLALGVSDPDFDTKFYEKHGTYWPDAMGDLEYSADRVTEGVLTLFENTRDAIYKKDKFVDNVDKAAIFDETFNDEIFKALRKLYNKNKSIISENFVEYAKEENQKYFNDYIETMLITDRGQITDDWHKAHSALYVDDSVEYGATVAQAYKKALQAVGINTQQSQKDIEEANTKTVMLATGVKFIYAKNISAAPEQFINDAIAAGKDLTTVRGGVMPDGTVVVIGNAHTDLNDLQETIEHELIGHYAVDTLLGPEGMKALVKKVFAGGEEGVLKLATELGVYDDVTEAFAAAKGTNMSEEAMRMLVTREMVAHVAERPLPSKASQMLKDFIKMVVNAVRQFFTGSGFDNMPSKTTQDIFNLVREAKKQYEAGRLGAYRTPDGNTAFSAPTTYSGKVQKSSINVINKIFPKKKTFKDELFANVIGLPGYTQFIDRLAPAEKIIKKAESAGMLDAVNALETTMYLRLTDQRLNMTAQAATSGVPQLVKNAVGETEVLGKKDGANLIKVGNILQRAKMLGNAQAVNNLFGLYLVAKRAKRVGLKTLASDLRVTEKELNDVVANIEQAGAKPIFEEAAKVYAEYNKDLINFLVQTGALSKQEGFDLTKYNDYVPFYRVQEGMATLVISKEHTINIGRLTDQPYLHELVGGKEMILNFEESAFQNTSILVDMGLRNLATGKLTQQLEKLGTAQTKIATRVSPKMKGTNIVRAKVNGVDAAWLIKTEGTPFEDIPADLLIKGLDGIKLQIPVAIKLLGLPSRWLRTMITRDPAYSVRQIIKDSTAMWLYSGANAKPVIDATKELGSMWFGKNKAEEELQRAGLVGGQLFTGMPEDMSRIMLQITSGKTGWQSLLAKLDRLSMQGDGATRLAMYNSYLKQGMTPMRAKLAVLESLNVNKRGLSPSVYWMSTLVPFMNTQVQGLTMFAKAMSGKNDLAGQKDLRMKLFKRGTYLAAFTVMYAAAMQDEEAYKNADPFVKYNSWFIPLPFLKEPLRVPTPFEFGYVFKALPESVFNMMFNDEKASNVLKFFKQAASNSTPIGIPQAIKPAIEAAAGFSFFTGEQIESARERGMLPGYRERPQTTEFAKLVSSLDKENLSPVMLDYLAKGYGGGLTLALTSLLNPVLAPTSDVAAPTKMPSQYPIVGGFFQPVDSNGVINAAYETAERAQKASKTLNQIAAKGNKQETEAFVRKFTNDLLLEEAAGAFTREMGELAAAERAIRADTRMSADDKAEKIKQLRAIRIKMAEALNKASNARE